MGWIHFRAAFGQLSIEVLQPSLESDEALAI